MNPSSDSSLPEPPFSPELLAQYDADALPDDVAAHITRRLPDDPDAGRILRALAATRAELAAAPVEPVEPPPAAAARLHDLLRDLGNTSP